MRVSIRHTTSYRYDAPGLSSVQRLRLTPADNPSQRILSWTIAADGIEEAVDYVDGFGNRTHLITHDGPYTELSITAAGDVETFDTGGVLGDLGEAADPRVFLRATPLTRSSAGINALAAGLPGRAMLERMHLLLEAIAGRIAYVPDSTSAVTSAAAAFKAGRGVCQDHAHIFIAAARRLSVPARYVTGYLHMAGDAPAVAHHAWAEAWLDGLGWVGFDPANHICPTEHYVRLACGFDAAGAAPVTGRQRGGGTESLTVDVMVRQQQQ
jgi:transglutaminase-like putative cysteine protease